MTRVVLLGATGYTGRLVAEALIRRGIRPVLAGRSAARLDALAGDLGSALANRPETAIANGLETAVATAQEPASIARLVERGDILITTVGPFLQFGKPALDAAIATGAHYLDTTGEATFVQAALEQRDAEARAAGSLVLPAFGFDYVPGHLAGALALEAAGEGATRLDVGYFFDGSQRGALSRGTIASAGGILGGAVSAYRDGALVAERAGASIGTYEVDGRTRHGLALGCTEVLFLPRTFPGLRTIEVHQGGLGPMTRPISAISPVFARPRVSRAIAAFSRKVASRPVHGPTASARAGSGTVVVAMAGVDGDAGRRPPARVALRGPNVYDATAEIIAWTTAQLLDAPPSVTGVRGPLEVFGTAALQAGFASIGITAG